MLVTPKLLIGLICSIMWMVIKQWITLQNGLRLLVGVSLIGEAVYGSMPLFGMLGIFLLAQIITNKKCAAPGCEIKE